MHTGQFGKIPFETRYYAKSFFVYQHAAWTAAYRSGSGHVPGIN